jgi:hypothetical protein
MGSIPVFTAFQKNFSHFTQDKDPRKKKTVGYYVEKSQAIYSTYLNGSSAQTENDVNRIARNRAYANNNQSEDIYKDYFASSSIDVDGAVFDKASGFFMKQGEQARKGFMNILWSVVSPASTVVTNLLAITEANEYNISCDPTDPISKDMAEEQKLHTIAVRDNLEFIKGVEQQTGIPFDKPEFLPENDEELLLYERLGGFKPAFAEKMEILLQHTDDISDFDRIASMCKRDAIVNNEWVFRERYNPETSKVELEYIDIERFIDQWSIYNDHRDSEYGAHWYEMSISQLYQWFPDEEQEFFANIAQSYCGHLGNPATDMWSEYNKQNGMRWGYDSWKVAVLHTEWIDVDSRKYEITPKWNERSKIREVNYEKVVDDKDKMVNFADKRFRFECEWIVGSEIAFNYGKVYSVRPSPKDACLTYHHYKLDGQSKVEMAIPFFDDFMICWCKLQNIFAFATSDLKEVNVDKLISLSSNPKDDGGAEQKIAMKKLLETSYAFYSNSGIGGLPGEREAPMIRSTPGGMGVLFQEIIIKIDLNAKLIERVTGINPLVLGSTPGTEDPVTTNMAAAQATANTLKPIISGWYSSRKKSAETISRFIQILIQFNKESRKAYEDVIGKFGCDVIEASLADNRKLSSSTNSSVDMGIKMQLRPDSTAKQELLKASASALMPDKNGNSFWSLPDHVLLTDMIESGKPLKAVWWYFSRIQDRNKKKYAAETAATQQAIDKATKEQNAQKAALLEQSDQKNHERRMAELNKEGENALKKAGLTEGIRKEKEIEKENIKQSNTQ